jgi:hypothetical protein
MHLYIRWKLDILLNSFRISWIFLIEIFKAMTPLAALQHMKEQLQYDVSVTRKEYMLVFVGWLYTQGQQTFLKKVVNLYYRNGSNCFRLLCLKQGWQHTSLQHLFSMSLLKVEIDNIFLKQFIAPVNKPFKNQRVQVCMSYADWLTDYTCWTLRLSVMVGSSMPSLSYRKQIILAYIII